MAIPEPIPVEEPRQPTPESETAPDLPPSPAESIPSAPSISPVESSASTFVELTLPLTTTRIPSAQPKPGYRDRVTRNKQRQAQLCLF